MDSLDHILEPEWMKSIEFRPNPALEAMRALADSHSPGGPISIEFAHPMFAIAFKPSKAEEALDRAWEASCAAAPHSWS